MRFLQSLDRMDTPRFTDQFLGVVPGPDMLGEIRSIIVHSPKRDAAQPC